jgi:hypothetical protein
VAGQVRLEGFGQVRAGAEGGRGPKPTIPQEKIDEIVELTMNSTPDGETHWSCRSMAERVGVSKDTVQRVWSARGLRPHLVATFTVSNDPLFEEQLVDVVGLYLDPPDNAGVLCMDESPPCRRWIAPSCRCRWCPAGPQTMTNDYKASQSADPRTAR